MGGGGAGLASRPFAEATQATIDGEVARLLREAEQSAVALIRGHQAEPGQLVELLLEKETVDDEPVDKIVGKPPPGHRPQELAIAPHARPRPTAADGSGPALRADPRHRPGTGPTASGTG